MADYKDRMADYVPVNERILEFYKEHPEGSLQSEMVFRNDTLVVMKAWAYRTPDDARPGVGHSSCPIPGLTPYTKNSEVENAETSAWGRAIAALGFEVKRGIATREDVQNKPNTSGGKVVVKRDVSPPPVGEDVMNAPITDAHRKVFEDAVREKMSSEQAKVWLKGQLVKMGATYKTLRLGQFNMLVENLGQYDLPKMEEYSKEVISDKDVEF